MNSARLLLFANIAYALGRALYFAFHDSPVRSVVWSENTFSPFVIFFTELDWSTYATSYADGTARFFDRVFSISYIVVVFSYLLNFKSRSRLVKTTYFQLILAISFAIFYFIGKQFNLGVLMELAIQTFTPIVFILCLKNQHEILIKICLVLVAFTFVGHGLFAIGYYPTPASFLAMTMDTLQLAKQQSAVDLLRFAAILDFIIGGFCVLHLVGLKHPYSKYVFAYATFWGFVTPFGRVSSYFSVHIDYYGIQSLIPQILFRVPHWIIPLVILLYLTRNHHQQPAHL